MLKCVLRFTATLKPCNPKAFPLTLRRHYDIRRRGGLEQAELDDDRFDSDKMERKKDSSTFKGNFKRSLEYSSLNLEDKYQERTYARKEGRQPFTARNFKRSPEHSSSSLADKYQERTYARNEGRQPFTARNFKRSPENSSSSLEDKYQERTYERKEGRQPFTKDNPRKQYSDSDNTHSEEDNVKDSRLIQYEKWLYDIRKYKESQRTPNFLTWKTKEEIRTLYREDPENFNLERLTSKYPVSKASIKQLLKNNWTPRSIVLHDQAAVKNWEDFVSGKIEIYDEDLRDQLQAFVRGSVAEESETLESLTKKLNKTMVASKVDTQRIIDVHREVPGAIESTPMNTSTENANTPKSYPESIVIPKNKFKEGATYRIKDCYYHSDGTFLYRVPGMEDTS